MSPEITPTQPGLLATRIKSFRADGLSMTAFKSFAFATSSLIWPPPVPSSLYRVLAGVDCSYTVTLIRPRHVLVDILHSRFSTATRSSCASGPLTLSCPKPHSCLNSKVCASYV